ncbi:MAG: ArnT family glycosyltransferase [Lachnospiraceae bacterium]
MQTMQQCQPVARKEYRWEFIFLAGLFCFYFIWALTQPFDSAPDERMRFEVVEYIFRHGSLPSGGELEIRDELWGFSYAFNPILPYMIAAVFMKAASFFSSNAFVLVMAARMVSILSGVGTAFFAIRIARNLFPGKARWFNVVLVALLPSAVFVTSYVNCDAFAIFSTAVIVYCWIRGVQTRWDSKSCIGLALGISMCALSYYNAYGFILCSILFYGITQLLFCRQQHAYKAFWQKGLLISVIVLVLIGWWFIRNYMLYDGDLLGSRTSTLYGELYAAAEYKPSARITPQGTGISLWEMLVQPWGTFEDGWVSITAESFIGTFGYLNVFLSKKVVYVYWALLLGGLGLLLVHPVKLFAVRCKAQWQVRPIFNWCMLLAALIPNILNVYYSYTSDYQPQGRYSLPMLLPLMYLVATGYQNAIEKFIKKERWRNIVYIVLAAGIALAAIYAYVRVLYPAYH